MRVALISPVYPSPKAGFFPGIERYAQGLSGALLKRGVEVKLVTSFWNGGGRREVVGGLEIHRVGDLSARVGRIGRVLDLHYYTLGRSILREREDVILWSDVVHTLMPLSCAGEVRELRPLVSHFHHPAGIEGLLDILYVPFHHRIERSTYRNSDAVVVQSNYGAEALSKLFGVDRSKVHVCYCGVDVEEFSPRVGREGGGRINLLFVGVLEKRKGLEYLLLAMKRILEREPRARLAVVGGGPRRRALEELAKGLGISGSVSFEGFVPEERLRLLYGSADIFVFPSLMEGFGMVLAEAMACGLPIVACRASAIPEVVGEAGVLVEPRSPGAIAEAVLMLIKDEELRARLGREAGRRARERFTWDRVAERVIRVYERVMESSRARASSAPWRGTGVHA